MPLLPATMQAAAERPHGRTPWIWLWDVELAKRTKTLPPVVFRFTSHHAPITWPPGSPPEPMTFYPFPFEQTEIEQTQDADLPSLDLAVDNTTGLVMRYMHEAGFVGNRAWAYLTHADALASPVYPNHEQSLFKFTIVSSVASLQSVTFRLEQPDLYQKRIPTARFVSKRCRWRFGSPECGYPITPAAAFDFCDHTIDACIERGDDEVARFLPRLHPRRFGGFPGIASQRGIA